MFFRLIFYLISCITAINVMHQYSVQTCYRDCNAYIRGDTLYATCGLYSRNARYDKCVMGQYKRAENCRLDCAVCI